MAIFIKKLNTKATLAVVVLAGVTAGLFSGVFASAAGPQFNVFPVTYVQPSGPSYLDYPMIDARKIGGAYSNSDADHEDGLTVNPNEEFEVSIYYHNGTVDDPANTAINTLIKAFADPTLGNPSLSHVLSATVSADNAAPVSSSDPALGGDMKIFITGTKAQTLSLVPGSVKNFKNWGSRIPANGSPNISQIVSLPNTIFNEGVNIGDVRGCWPFFGFVSFRLKTSNVQPTRGLEITKGVLNATVGETTFGSTTSAHQGDIVRFQVQITATGDGAQTGVNVRDNLPSRLGFLTGDNLEGVGINVGDLNPGESRIYTFDAQVLGSTSGTVTNTARVKSNEVSEKSASATVSIVQHERNLTIQKTVRNVTRNEASFVEQTTARQNEIVEYQVVIGTTGTGGQTNVTVRDALSSRLEFIDGDDIRGVGMNLGDMAPNQSKTLTYQARILGENSATITNIAKVKSDQVSDKQDKAKVVIEAIVRGLTIQKTVRNVTRNEASFVEQTTARENEIVEYQVVIGTTGTGGQTGVVVSDAMSSRLEYVSGDDLRGTGVTIGELAQDQTRTLTYQARILGSSSATITNTAKVKSEQVGTKSDSAKVVIEAIVRGLTIQKTVRNVTAGQSSFEDSTSAREGDIVEYQVVINTTGTGGQNNVTVRDALHSRLQFVSGDDLRTGLNLGSHAQDQTITLVFQAKILGYTAATVTNTAKVRSDEVNEKSDSAKVTVQAVKPPGEPGPRPMTAQ